MSDLKYISEDTQKTEKESWFSFPKEEKAKQACILYMVALILINLAGIYSADTSFIVAGIAALLFMVITGWSVLKAAFIFSLIVGVACTIFPVLIFVAVIIMVVLFILRIKFLIQHFSALISGVKVYGMLFIIPLIYKLYYSIDEYEEYLAIKIIFIVVASWLVVSFTLIFIRTLKKLMEVHRYTSSAALGIMGIVPLFILAFALPFLKILVHDGMIFSEGSVFEGHATITEPTLHAVDGVATTAPDGVVEIHSGAVTPDIHAHNTNPGVVHVKGYVRSDGTVVQAYDRSAPDMFKSNNFGEIGNHSINTGMQEHAINDNLSASASKLKITEPVAEDIINFSEGSDVPIATQEVNKDTKV